MANFKDIIGQKQAKEHFQTAIETGNISHAYIINGETGSGRRMLADAFAKALQCEKHPNADSCDGCKSCHQAESGNHPDIRYITHEKASISVDDIREQLNNDIQIKPYSSEHKVYIIPEANKMTEQAQNALLKTIEEPPAYAVIILLTDNLNALLPTIQSRCVTINTKPISKEEIAGYLVSHLSMEREQAEIAAGFCQGNMGKAIRFANSKDFQEMKEDTLHLLKNIEHMDISEIVDSIRIFSQKKGMIDDYLDLMLLHQPFGDTYGAWRALEELYEAGKLRTIGISNHYVDRMVEFSNFTRIKPMVNQMEVHPLFDFIVSQE